MTAIRVTESSGSVGILQISDGTSEVLTLKHSVSHSIFRNSKEHSFRERCSCLHKWALNCKNTTRAGAALFGGDVVISGTLYAERQVIEVDELVPGDLLVSGSVVTSLGATIGGELTIAESLQSSTSKILILSGGAATRYK